MLCKYNPFLKCKRDVLNEIKEQHMYQESYGVNVIGRCGLRTLLVSVARWENVM